MRSAALFSFAWLILSVSAYGVVGTYERMWFWYAYQLDTKGTTIAPTCGKSMGIGAGTRCNFAQFMEWLNQGVGTPIEPDDLDGVDPDNMPEATAALEKGGFTGVYDCTHVWQGLQGNAESLTPAKDNVAGLFQKLGQFCLGRIQAGATAEQAQQMQQVTQAVLRGRQGNAATAYQEELGEGPNPIKVELGSIPLYAGAPAGAQYTAPTIDVGGTVGSPDNPNLTRKAFGAAIQEVTDSDGFGHAANIKAAREANAAVNLGCT